MRYKYQIISVLSLIIIWQVFCYAVDQPYLYPSIDKIAIEMFNQFKSPIFYESMLVTLVRAIIGFSLAGISAFMLSYIAYKNASFKAFFAPILMLCRSIPNIAYIIIILIWFGSESSSIIICYLVIFPIMYAQFYEGFRNISYEHQQVLKMYPIPFFKELLKYRLPLMNTFSMAACRSGCSLAIKVGVMAEILGAIQVGIGRQLLLDKIAFNMIGIFAWSIWMVLLLLILDRIITIIFKSVE